MEKQDSVDQRLAAVDRFITRHAEGLKRQGAIVVTFRQRNGRRLGPYYRLTCRSDGQRQMSVYLGAEGPLVATTRDRLAQLQAPRRQQRRWAELREVIHGEMKRARRQLGAMLAEEGLTMKGSEIRGWRTRRAGRNMAEVS